MRKFKKILVALLMALPIFGYAGLDASVYIINGTTASVNTFASFSSLFYDRIEYDGMYSPVSFCGATMLSDQYVLTAAHCIFDGSGNLDEEYMLFTVVGQTDNQNDFPASVVTSRAAEFYYHPDYKDSETYLWANDIAIIKLETSLNIAGTANRATDESYRSSGNTFVTVGHGETYDASNESELLQTNLTYIDNTSCQSYFTDGDALTDKQICFKGAYNSSTGLYNGVCSGDSGGPVYYYNGSTYTQVGITSFGPVPCGSSADVTSVFTEISDYDAWISDVLAGNIQPQYVATDAKREAFLGYDDGGTSGSLTPTKSSSGGGSVGIGLLGLLMATVARNGMRHRRLVPVLRRGNSRDGSDH